MPEVKKVKNVGENQFGDVCTLPGNRIGQLEAVVGIEKGEINLVGGEVPYLEMYSLMESEDNTAWGKLGYLIRKAKARGGNSDDCLIELWRVDKKIKIQMIRGLVTRESKIKLMRVIEEKKPETFVYYVLPNAEMGGSNDDDNNIGDMLNVPFLTNVSNWSVLQDLKTQVFTPVKFHLYRKIYRYPDNITYLWSILIPTPPLRREISIPKGGIIEVGTDQLNLLREIGLIDDKTLEMALVAIAAEGPSIATHVLEEIDPDWRNNFFEDGRDAIIGFRKELGLEESDTSEP